MVLSKIPVSRRPTDSDDSRTKAYCGRNRWMDDLRFYVLFNSISVISGRCIDDNERLCAMELRLRLRRFHLE